MSVHEPDKRSTYFGNKLLFSEMAGALKRRDMLVLIPMYSIVLIPLSCFMLWFSRKIDRRLNVPEMPRRPYNIILWAFFSAAGFVILWWTYAYLSLLGKGSPMTFVNRTKKLVVTGPYAYSRNPSIIAKLLGVIGLGFLGRSFSFTFLLIPLLLTGSLAEKKIREEPALVEQFGKDYIRYREDVPMFIPRVTKWMP